MSNFLVMMEKAVCTLGSIALQDQKIKSNNYHFLCVRRLINILFFISVQYLNWIERYSTMKIGRFFFVWVYMHILFPHQHKSQEIRQYNKNFTSVKKQFIRLTSIQLHESDTRIDLFFNERSICNSKAVYDPCCKRDTALCHLARLFILCLVLV